jgi:ankyrin repeat protein
MLLSSRSPALASSSMSHFDSNSDRSYQTNASSLIAPTSVPKNFTVPFAIQHGYFRCVRYLLELSYDPNERDSQLHTPLILCSYVENDRWSLSLAQNLLEKGAKIALADNARRNA